MWNRKCSRSARLALQRKRKDWSRRKALQELNWLSLPQMAAQATLKLEIEAIQHKKPVSFYETLMTETGELRHKFRAQIWNPNDAKDLEYEGPGYLKVIPEDLRNTDVTKAWENRKLCTREHTHRWGCNTKFRVANSRKHACGTKC